MDLAAHRPVVMTRRGLVVAGNPSAANAGAQILRDGGNAVDAAIAAAAVLAVTSPHMNGLGGDAFGLVHVDGKSFSINASGAAPTAATIEAFHARGLKSIPVRGALSISVPGAVDGWMTTLDRFGRLPRRAVLGPAIGFARDGAPLDRHLVEHFNSPLYLDLCRGTPALAKLLGPPAGRRLGETLRQPALAGVLEALAQQGAEVFYRGPVGLAICDAVRMQGGLLAPTDLAAHETYIEAPLEITWRGATLKVCPPNTQGLALALILALLEMLGVSSTSPTFAPALARSKEVAFTLRDRYLQDPRQRGLPVSLFDPQHLQAEWLGELQVPMGALRNAQGDTTCVVVVDAEGNAVSWVQSLFEEFGSAVVSLETGIILQNRLSLARLESGSPLALAPGRRPPHTLCPALVCLGGRCQIAAATPGGHGQPQTLAQILLNLQDRKMDAQAAVEAPRFLHESGRVILCESRLDERMKASLERSGWRVRDVGPWAQELGLANSMGAAMVITRDETGLHSGGADPRRDCYAVAQ